MWEAHKYILTKQKLFFVKTNQVTNRYKLLKVYNKRNLGSSECCVRYNVLFAFLLRVRRVQLVLQQCWALAMNRRHLRHAADSPNSTKWWLRNHMAFVVDNLQYYLQVHAANNIDNIL